VAAVSDHAGESIRVFDPKCGKLVEEGRFAND